MFNSRGELFRFALFSCKNELKIDLLSTLAPLPLSQNCSSQPLEQSDRLRRCLFPSDSPRRLPDQDDV